MNWPPGLSKISFNHVPGHLRDDAIQEAWLAHLEGRKPDSACRQLVRLDKRQSRRPRLSAYYRAYSKIDTQIDVGSVLEKLPDDLRAIADEMEDCTEKSLEILFGLTRSKVRTKIQKIKDVFIESGVEV